MKIKPFLSRTWSLIFLYTCLLSFPYWVVEMYSNVTYFNGNSNWFAKTRPLELLFRDPWWIITTVYLFTIIRKHYAMTIPDIIRISPRFGIMLASMIIAISFVICDVCAVTGVLRVGGNSVGINPFWKLAFAFKCLTDSVILDDFKMALDRLRAFKISRLGSYSADTSDRRTRTDNHLVQTWEKAEREARENQRNLSAKETSSSDIAPHEAESSGSFHFPFNGTPGKQKERDASTREESFFQQGAQYRDPLSMVRSAFDDDSGPESLQSLQSLQPVPPTHQPNAQGNSTWFDDADASDARDVDALELYANAQRDVEGQKAPQGPARKDFPRRSHTTV